MSCCLVHAKKHSHTQTTHTHAWSVLLRLCNKLSKRTFIQTMCYMQKYMLFIIYEWSCHMSSSEHASFVCLLLTNETLYGHPPGFVIHTGRGYHALGRILKFLSWLTNLLVQQGQPTASSHLRSHPKLSLIMYDSLQKSWCRPEVKRSSTAPSSTSFYPEQSCSSLLYCLWICWTFKMFHLIDWVPYHTAVCVSLHTVNVLLCKCYWKMSNPTKHLTKQVWSGGRFHERNPL